jgi:Tfp pilus assembly protein PilN
MGTRVIGLLVSALLAALVAPGWARGPWRASEANTRGWQLMTPTERIEHQSRIRSFTSYEECRAYQLSHHQLMERRARQMNKVLPGGGRNFCEHLRPRPDHR